MYRNIYICTNSPMSENSNSFVTEKSVSKIPLFYCYDFTKITVLASFLEILVKGWSVDRHIHALFREDI